MSVKDIVKRASKSVLRAGPLWQGPEGDGPQGGITQSMISRWLSCKERFRVKVMEGWKGVDQFSKALEYGNCWHVCEEALAGFNDDKKYQIGSPDIWEPALKIYVKSLLEKYPIQQEDIDHWYRTCKTQFPVYVDYWAKHKDVEQRTPLMQEQVFDVPYELPSGRVVRLRGKFDSVDLIGKGKSAGIYLQENKTKGDVDQGQIQSQLLFDLQTMLYLVSLENIKNAANDYGLSGDTANAKVSGVRYNVVRRPFSGGKGSIKRHSPTKSNPKGESKDEFYARLQNDYFRAEPEYWFMRWKSEVSPADVKRFRDECLDPLLEAICWWYDMQTNSEGVRKNEIGYPAPNFHWRHPYGIHNYIDEGYGSDVDKYIETGSTVGLVKNDNLFPELT